MWLVHDKRGQRFTLSAMQRRFSKLSPGWQIRDLRAKAASYWDILQPQQPMAISADVSARAYFRSKLRVVLARLCGQASWISETIP